MIINTIHAYIDPATTSYIIQIAAGIIIAGGAAIGIFWNKLTRLFRKKKDGEEETKAPIKKNDDGDAAVITADDLLDEESDS